MSWMCKACRTCNWESRVTCRSCSAVQWPSPTAAAGKPKGGTKRAGGPGSAPGTTPPAGASPPSVGVAGAPKGSTEPPTVAQLKAEVAGLKASLDALGPATSQGSAATATARESLQAGIDDLEARIRDQRSPLERLQGLRGAIGRGRRRLTEMNAEREAIVNKIEAEEELLAKRQGELEELERELMEDISKDKPGFRVGAQAAAPPWLAEALEDLAALLEKGATIDRSSMAASLRGLAVPPPAPMPPDRDEATGDAAMGETSGTPSQYHIGCSDDDLDSTPVPMKQASATLAPQAVTPSDRRKLSGKHLVETPQLGAQGSARAGGA